jgi:hypothetical protein
VRITSFWPLAASMVAMARLAMLIVRRSVWA